MNSSLPTSQNFSRHFPTLKTLFRISFLKWLHTKIFLDSRPCFPLTTPLFLVWGGGSYPLLPWSKLSNKRQMVPTTSVANLTILYNRRKTSVACFVIDTVIMGMTNFLDVYQADGEEGGKAIVSSLSCEGPGLPLISSLIELNRLGQ